MEILIQPMAVAAFTVAEAEGNFELKTSLYNSRKLFLVKSSQYQKTSKEMFLY